MHFRHLLTQSAFPHSGFQRVRFAFPVNVPQCKAGTASSDLRTGPFIVFRVGACHEVRDVHGAPPGLGAPAPALRRLNRSLQPRYEPTPAPLETAEQRYAQLSLWHPFAPQPRGQLFPRPAPFDCFHEVHQREVGCTGHVYPADTRGFAKATRGRATDRQGEKTMVLGGYERARIALHRVCAYLGRAIVG